MFTRFFLHNWWAPSFIKGKNKIWVWWLPFWSAFTFRARTCRKSSIAVPNEPVSDSNMVHKLQMKSSWKLLMHASGCRGNKHCTKQYYLEKQDFLSDILLTTSHPETPRSGFTSIKGQQNNRFQLFRVEIWKFEITTSSYYISYGIPSSCN